MSTSTLGCGTRERSDCPVTCSYACCVRTRKARRAVTLWSAVGTKVNTTYPPPPSPVWWFRLQKKHQNQNLVRRAVKPLVSFGLDGHTTSLMTNQNARGWVLDTQQWLFESWDLNYVLYWKDKISGGYARSNYFYFFKPQIEQRIITLGITNIVF